jgi:hypothetical protein
MEHKAWGSQARAPSSSVGAGPVMSPLLLRHGIPRGRFLCVLDSGSSVPTNREPDRISPAASTEDPSFRLTRILSPFATPLRRSSSRPRSTTETTRHSLRTHIHQAPDPSPAVRSAASCTKLEAQVGRARIRPPQPARKSEARDRLHKAITKRPQMRATSRPPRPRPLRY